MRTEVEEKGGKRVFVRTVDFFEVEFWDYRHGYLMPLTNCLKIYFNSVPKFSSVNFIYYMFLTFF